MTPTPTGTEPTTIACRWVADLLASVRAKQCWTRAGWFRAGSKRQVKGRYQTMLLMAADHTRRAIMRGVHQSSQLALSHPRMLPVLLPLRFAAAPSHG